MIAEERPSIRQTSATASGLVNGPYLDLLWPLITDPSNATFPRACFYEHVVAERAETGIISATEIIRIAVQPIDTTNVFAFVLCRAV